jgi:hypothetical protein
MPNAFARSPDGFKSPPLVSLIQGGRGGEIRLKLFLCMAMMATRAPHDINRPFTPQGWARLLNLSVDDGAARRISSNIKWLNQNTFIHLEPRRGNTPRIQLLDPTTGQLFTRPTTSFISIPLDIWRYGWILELSATGLALLIVLLDLCGNATSPRYVTRHRRESYVLSSDTWTRATKELKRHGLITVGRTPQGDEYDPERLRNTFWIEKEALGRLPSTWH